MKTYLVTVIVEFQEDEYKDWSEGADETFSIARKLNAQDNGVHILGYNRARNNAFDKYTVLTEEGGV